jgi:diguanylate cyclase (GGDEF)-like protein/PAS domain S-box-containing protein
MTAQQWSRDELNALARDSQVLALDAAAGAVDPPEWILASGEPMDYESFSAVERIHPADRGRIVELFQSAIEEPGALRSGTFRVKLEEDDRWAHLEVNAVNLLDDPDVGCILFASHEVAGEDIDGPEHDTDAGHASTNWMLLTLNGSGTITTVEGNARAMLGYEPHEVIGVAPTSLVHPDHLVDSIRLWRALVENPNETRTSQRRWIRKTGEEIWIESSYVNRGPDYAEEVRFLVVMWDITERRAAERALRDREAELVRMADDFRLLADEVPAAVLRCTGDGTVVFHNSRWHELLENRSEVARLHDLFDEASGELLDEALANGREPGDSDQTVVELEGDDGTSWRLTLRPLMATGEGQGDYIGSLQDISLTVRLRMEATHDPLTGLLNRAAMEAELNEVLASGGDAVVAFVDLDHFKMVNDTWGHDAGDAVLIEVANRLTSAVRTTDAVGRWGGDEFVVVFHSPRSDAKNTLVEALVEALDDEVDFGSGTWVPSASIGAAMPQAGDDVDAVVNRADQAMLHRKRLRPGSSSR